jgi:hypothetical protein
MIITKNILEEMLVASKLKGVMLDGSRITDDGVNDISEEIEMLQRLYGENILNGCSDPRRIKKIARTVGDGLYLRKWDPASNNLRFLIPELAYLKEAAHAKGVDIEVNELDKERYLGHYVVVGNGKIMNIVIGLIDGAMNHLIIRHHDDKGYEDLFSERNIFNFYKFIYANKCLPDLSLSYTPPSEQEKKDLKSKGGSIMIGHMMSEHGRFIGPLMEWRYHSDITLRVSLHLLDIYIKDLKDYFVAIAYLRELDAFKEYKPKYLPVSKKSPVDL